MGTVAKLLMSLPSPTSQRGQQYMTKLAYRRAEKQVCKSHAEYRFQYWFAHLHPAQQAMVHHQILASQMESPRDHRRHDEIFARLDRNHDGVINSQELRVGLKGNKFAVI